MLLHRWDTVLVECWRGRPSPTDAERVEFRPMSCKGAIEALAIDLWSIRDWLVNDPTASIDPDVISDFVTGPGGMHIRGCADLATRLKHHSVDDAKRNLLELVEVIEFPDGEPPIFYAAEKIIFLDEDPNVATKRRKRGEPRPETANRDSYPDAVEMLQRAKSDWTSFLVGQGLLPDNGDST